MTPLLHDATILDITNHVCSPDGRQPVGYDNCRPLATRISLQHPVQGLLHDELAFVVQRGGGLVQEQDLGLLHQGPGDSDPLLLPAAQLGPPKADVCLIPLVKAADEVVGIRLLCGLHNVFPGDIPIESGSTIANVLRNGPAEELRLLGYDPDPLPEPSHVQVPQVPAVEKDPALQRVIEPLQELRYCALAASTLPNQRQGLSWLHDEVETLAHGGVRPRRVAEADSLKLELALCLALAWSLPLLLLLRVNPWL